MADRPLNGVDQSALSECFASFDRSAFRCERQPLYVVPDEQRSVQRFTDGIEHDPTDEAYFADGFAEFRRLTTSGRRLERVRVHEDPPNDYQRWLQWLGQWNTDAGEVIHYLTRAQAEAQGLVRLGAPGDDFWLFDDTVVVVLRFDVEGHLIETRRDRSADAVEAAVAWKTAALRYVHEAASTGP